MHVSGQRPMLSGTKVEDPLGQLPVGASLSIEPVVFGGTDATPIPDGVTNWTYFGGSLMTILVKNESGVKAMGTVVAIAPGLAVTATHVLPERLEAVLNGEAALLCAAPTERGLQLWDVRNVNFTPEDDIAFLSLELASEVYEDWRVQVLPVTTRAPKAGEKVHVIGFRLETVAGEGHSFTLTGDLYAAAGEVVAVYHPIRDPMLMPFPTIEIACGAVAGMSGGAVLDDFGHLLGVISRSFTAADGRGPTSAAWIVGGINRELEITWPSGVYPQPVHLLDIDGQLLRLEGRDRVRVIDGNTYEYQVWFGR